ncbi:MAG TPA: protein phosphatase 2C domain-containing protein [Gemmataceae bacterium]|nr:protein phosphatase 2C domain-containing protein [Gemmataceae bacterium]
MAPADPLRWTVLTLPKHGCSDDEYEDAWAVDPVRGRFAVADGASESSFAGRWAQLLTEAFLTADRSNEMAEWLEEPRRRWSAEVMDLELPWYAETKREQGAYAALLGVSVRRPSAHRPGKWRATAIGDSCLIRVRQGGRLQSFPMHKSTDFGNQPRLLGSRGAPVPKPDRASGALRPGDRLFLATDALAQWFLHSHEQGGRPGDAAASVLSAADADAAFADWIAGLRQGGGLRNDDVTLLLVECGPAAC